MSWMGEGAWWGWPVATRPATQKKPKIASGGP